jgi:hypothetical protein
LVYNSSSWKPKTRTISHATLTWNGVKSTFFVISQQLAGWARMSGLGYVFNPRFMQDFIDGGWDAVEHTVLPIICHNQFNYDYDHLYGDLQVDFANAANVANLVMFYHQRTNAAAHLSPASGL